MSSTQTSLSGPVVPSAEELAERIRMLPRHERGGCLYGALWISAGLSGVAGLLEWGTGLDRWQSLLLLATSGFLWRIAARMRRLLVESDAAQAALALRDVPPSGAHVFVELLQWPDGRVRASARQWLTAVLPQLSEEDASAMPDIHRARLFDALNMWEALRHPAFVSAILQALPQLADERVLPALRRLARTGGWTSTLRRIRQGALAAVAPVERRVYHQRLAVREAASPAQADVLEREDVASYAGFGAELGVQPQMRLGFLIAAWAVIIPFGLAKGYQLLAQGDWPGALACGALAVAATQLHRVTLLGRHRRMVHQLLQENDPLAVGRIAEAVLWPDERVRSAAMSALARLLPQLTGEHATVLTTGQRQCLYTLLNRGVALRHPEAVVALIRALERIGDVASIRYVRALAEANDPSARLSAVREAARACLPVLLERARRNTDPQVLLRPAEAAGPDASVLVRPVEPGESGESGLLVRPADPPSG